MGSSLGWCNACFLAFNPASSLPLPPFQQLYGALSTAGFNYRAPASLFFLANVQHGRPAQLWLALLQCCKKFGKKKGCKVNAMHMLLQPESSDRFGCCCSSCCWWCCLGASICVLKLGSHAAYNVPEHSLEEIARGWSATWNKALILSWLHCRSVQGLHSVNFAWRTKLWNLLCNLLLCVH